MSRAVPEWIGKTPVPRKRAGTPLTLAYFRDRSRVDPETGCWLWQGALQQNGYGAVRSKRATRNAHRIAYQIATGEELSSDIDVCHRCDVRACVNPVHLFAGSRRDNMRDCAEKGRIKVPRLAGDSCPNSKLTGAQVAEIRKDPRSARALAPIFGVCRTTIGHIRRGSTWRAT